MPTGMTSLGWVASSNPTSIGVFKFEPLANRSVWLKAATSPGQQFLIRELNKIEACNQTIYGWEYRTNVNNPGVLSEHGAGIAFDYNAAKHPNGVRGTWKKNEERVDGLLARIAMAAGRPVFRWGEHYRTTPDGMHFEVLSQQAMNAMIAGLQLDINGYPKEVPVATLTFPFLAKYGDVIWLVRGEDKVRVLTPADAQSMIDHGIVDLGPVGAQFLTYWPEGKTGF